MVPTRRRVYVRKHDGSPVRDTVSVAIVCVTWRGANQRADKGRWKRTGVPGAAWATIHRSSGWTTPTTG